MELDRAALKSRKTLVRGIIGLTARPAQAWWRILLLLLGCQIVLLGLHFTATVILSDLAAETIDGQIGGFDLEAEGTIAVWFSSLQLLLMGILCLFISWFDRDGRHGRKPDFWSLGVLVFILMSIDETAALHEMFGGSMVRFFPRVPISASHWWAIPYGAVLGTFFIFLVLRLRRFPRLLAGTVAGVGLWALSIFLEIYWLLPDWANVAMEEWAEMLGTACLIGVFGFYLLALAGPEEKPRKDHQIKKPTAGRR